MSAPRGDAHPNAKVTDRRIQQIKKMRAQGWQVREIAREFGVHECSVSRYLHDRGRVGQAERAAALSAHTTEGDPT